MVLVLKLMQMKLVFAVAGVTGAAIAVHAAASALSSAKNSQEDTKGE
jgi:hypothetical protein